jgi:uncharacterized protein
MGGMQRPGMGGPGYGAPGYGAPGYGGGGGGFMSGLLGGLGGAVAGNWLYDQFSGGRHNATHEAGGYQPDGYSSGIPDQGNDEIIGANDDAGGGASWDDSPADAGGGDWGGGGGDWGGGGDAGGDW